MDYNVNSRMAVLLRGLVIRPLSGQKGVSLVELLLVISVIGILAVALGFSYQSWLGGYNVEKQIKEIYTDLMTARTNAMNNDRLYFADFPNTTSYRIIGDTAVLNDWKIDGDGEWDKDNDNKMDPEHTVLTGYPKTLEYPIKNWGCGTIVFDSKGLVKTSGCFFGATIELDTTVNADFDCIIISSTRINMGKMNGGSCSAK